MPLYTYRCPECGHTVEEIRAVADRDNTPPGCYLHEIVPDVPVFYPMERVQAAPAFKVKGFSAVNNYSRTDTGWVRDPALPGIRTRVSDAPEKA